MLELVLDIVGLVPFLIAALVVLVCIIAGLLHGGLSLSYTTSWDSTAHRDLRRCRPLDLPQDPPLPGDRRVPLAHMLESRKSQPLSEHQAYVGRVRRDFDDALIGVSAMDSTSPGSVEGPPNGWPTAGATSTPRPLSTTPGCCGGCLRIRTVSGRPPDAKYIFSLKAFAYVDALALMAPRLDGFAASSLFEARLASQVLPRPWIAPPHDAGHASR